MGDCYKISLSDIVVGQPLPWDVMDSSGHLLLRAGYIIEQTTQAEHLVERGMYVVQKLKQNYSAATTVQNVEPPSVIRSINLVVSRLEILLQDIQKFTDARKRVLYLVSSLRSAIKMNEDIALASIQINQASGNYCARHCVDAAIICILVAESLGKLDQEVQDIAAAALTMNISMKSLQEKLQGIKGELSDEDKLKIRQHPVDTVEMLYDAGIEDEKWLLYVLLHHEMEDGSGYPEGRKKDECPQNAKILSLADSYCARISPRGYRKAVLPNTALKDIFIENSSKVDTNLAKYFVKVLGLHPPGTFIRLQNGEVAIVSHRGSTPNTNVAYSLVKSNNEVLSNPAKRDTSLEEFKITAAIHPIEASVNLNFQQVWGSLARL